MTRATLVDRGWQLAYRTAYPLLRTWWRLRQAPHRGALIALSVDDTVLLVQSSYRAEWSFPGGGVDPAETPRQAANRELREELSLVAPIESEPVVIQGRWDGRPETVHVFALSFDAPPPLQIDRREVIATRFVTRAELADMNLSGPATAYCRCVGLLTLPAQDEHA